jgi:hypothetical protein
MHSLRWACWPWPRALVLRCISTMVQARQDRPHLSQCPRGHACVWEGQIVVGDPRPQHRYYTYGTYNFVNEYGDHVAWNNQTDGARVQLCLGYNGTTCRVTIAAAHATHGNLTPYNSIRLLP